MTNLLVTPAITSLLLTPYSTLDERYRAGVSVLNARLKQYHPDLAGDTPNNQRMTRMLLRFRAEWTKLYKELKMMEAQ